MLVLLDDDTVLQIDKAIDEQRVERSAIAVKDHVHGLLVRERLLVHAIAGQGIVDIDLEWV